MDGVSDHDLVERGSERTVAFAVDAAGRRQAREFLESSEVTDTEQARIERVCKQLAQVGRVNNRELFRKEDGEIWGIKAHQIRIGAFQVGRTWFLTHGFRKKQDRWPPAELERAERIRKEHLAQSRHD